MKKSFKVKASILVLALFVVLALGSENVDPQTQREANELYREVLGRDGPYKSYGRGLEKAAGLKTVMTATEIAMLGCGALLLFTPAAPKGALLIAGALISMPSSYLLFSTMESQGQAIANNPTATDFEVIAEYEPVEPFTPIDDSEFMIARAQYMTKLAEQGALTKALTDSFSRMQVAVNARKAEYALMQTTAAVNFIEMLEANLREQQRLILVHKYELDKYFSLEELEAEMGEAFEINFEFAVASFKEMSIQNINAAERTALFEAGLTSEEIEAFETILAGPFDWDEWDMFSAEAVKTAMDVQLEGIAEMLTELNEASALLKKLIDLAESLMEDVPELEYLYIRGGGGGGIYIAQNSSATIVNNNISDNPAEFGGGILVLNNSSATIEENITRENTAEYGGGILVVDSAASMAGNIISDNTAEFGAGLFLYLDSSAKLGENLFENNHATSKGGALWVYNHSALELNNPDDNIYRDNEPDDIYYYEE